MVANNFDAIRSMYLFEEFAELIESLLEGQSGVGLLCL